MEVRNITKRTTTVKSDEDLVLKAKIFCLKTKTNFSRYVEDLIKKKDLEKKGK